MLSARDLFMLCSFFPLKMLPSSHTASTHLGHSRLSGNGTGNLSLAAPENTDQHVSRYGCPKSGLSTTNPSGNSVVGFLLQHGEKTAAVPADSTV